MIGAQAPFDLDTTFKCAVQYRHVNSVAVMPDGKLLISGRLNFHWVTGEWSLARLNADGTRDLSWNFGVPAGNKITPWNNGYYVNNGAIIRRLNDDGYLDPTFIMMNNGPYFSSGQGGDYHVFPDGRVLMTGLHSLEDTIRGYTGLHSLIWFSNTGYLDTTQHHRKSNNAIYTIKEQPDGKFLCSGLCSVYEGQPVGRVFRVNADGDLDTTFQTDFDLGEASTFNALANGRILVSGYLGQPGGNDTLHMMRLLPNGALDSSFNNTLQVLGDVNGHLPVMHTRLEDGRIVLHGNFSSIDGQPRSGVAMIDSTGHLINDAFATPACGTYNDGFFDFHTTNGMVPDQAGNWYIYGTYIGYDDGTTNDPQQRFVSRLFGLNVGVREVEKPLALQVVPNPSTGPVRVELPEAIGPATLQVVDAQGRVVRVRRVATGPAVLDLTGQPAGVYAVRVRTEAGRTGHARIVLQP
ncbi:MAG: hypothetical protein GFGODING_01674 [Flavobacteriales bacterium]|nr:hypothetical protein [Flavobacteriales bacterium]